ncbi:hypothetical protein TWF481_008752 [Arthrobotrys musiformis]|uniref:F-box domain-containing protein n=1 Tax=Arthrobotrys musiformis TaxID=47236 RepID=A0AAV9W840_9PEZI
MVSISNLPNEILLKIFENLSTCLPPPRTTQQTRKRDDPWINLPRYAADNGLASACRVNRQFRELVTPILYKNVIIGGFDIRYSALARHRSVTNAHVLTPLIISNHSGRKYIRHVSIQPGTIEAPQGIRTNNLDRRCRALLIYFLWLLDPDQLSSLGTGYSGILPGCLKFNRLKSLMHTHRCPPSLARRWRPPTELNYSPALNVSSFGRLDLLETLKFRLELHSAWVELVSVSKKLKHLSLRPVGDIDIFAEPVTPLPPAKTLENLLRLESLDVQLPLDPSWDTFLPYQLDQFLQVKFLRSLCIRTCFGADVVLDAASPRLDNLTSLAVSGPCSTVFMDRVLYRLPRTLETFAYENNYTDNEKRFVERGAILRHAKTLRLLSLYITGNVQIRTPIDIPLGNVKSPVDAPPANPEDPFSIVDLCSLLQLEEVALSTHYKNISMFSRLPKLRALSILSRYFRLERWMVEYNPTSHTNLWILLQSWMNAVHNTMDPPETEGNSGTAQVQNPNDTGGQGALLEHVSKPHQLKAVKFISFRLVPSQGFNARNDYYILREGVNDTGGSTAIVRGPVQVHEVEREYPDIRIFNPFNEERVGV